METVQDDARKYLASIRDVYRSHRADLVLEAGASDADIASVARALLPETETLSTHPQPGRPGTTTTTTALDPVLTALWRSANGGPEYAPVFARPGYSTGYDFLSTAEAVALRGRLRTRAPQYGGYIDPSPRDARIRAGWYHPGWLPFASFGGGTLILLVDGSPAERGRKGQVIAYAHDPDQMSYVAGSMGELLEVSGKWFAEEGEEILEGVLDGMDDE
jgi:hypothetical protein